MSGYIGNIPTPQATQSYETFTATGGQTTFNTIGYTPGFLQVFLNGVLLVDGTDYTASNGSDVVLATGAISGDILTVISFSTFEVNSQTFTGTTTFTGDVNFGDNDKAIFGAGSDLQIYHDGSNSYVRDVGTGVFLIQGDSDIWLQNSTGTASYARFTNGGAATLYNNNNAKLATTATGIDVTGTAVTDGVQIGGTNYLSFTNTANQTYVRASASNTLDIGTDSTNRIRVNSIGDISFYEDTGTTPKFFWDASAESLGIGTSSPSTLAHLKGSGDFAALTIETATTGGASYINLGDSNDQDVGQIAYFNSDDSLRIKVNAAERMRIDSSGNVGIGLTTTSSKLHVNTEMSIGADGDNRAIVGYTPSRFYIGTRQGGVNYFDTVSVSSGNVLVGTTAWSSTSNGIQIGPNSNSRILITNSADYGLELYGATTNRVSFYTSAGGASRVGTITVSTSSTSYNTSSDYRLKEDVQPMVGASNRLMALKPVNFAWKADNSRVDGFLAHEAQEVVPEAVTGEKDAVDADGNPEYQGIDQSKLVPLLTAALQEALQKIDALEARVATLEAPQ